MYTRCPNCQTYFKISAEHLKKAGGKVRCGQCMKVFNSLGNLLEELPVSLAERTRPANAAPKPAPATAPPAKPVTTSSPRPVPAAPPPKPAPPPTPAPPPRPAARPRPTPPTRPPAPSVRRAAPAEATQRVLVVGEVNDEKTQHLDAEPMPSIDFNAPGDTLDLNSDDQVRNLDVGPTSSVRDLVPYPHHEHEPPAAAPALFGEAYYSGGVVFLLLVFIFQYSYFMRDDLARYPELRPWVQGLCGVLGCDIPVQQNSDLIKLTHRDITVHPRVKGALLINAVFVNTASYTQPFPVMQITLSDVSGRVVAKRRFQPAEYLDADVNLRSGMPSNSPIQIVLEIADPGKDAENFEFNFFYVNGP